MERSELDLSADYVAPRTELEKQLVAAWSKALYVEPVGLDDDFFELGGDSLSATALALAVGETFGIDFKPSHLLENSTPRMVAAIADRAAAGLMLPSNVTALNPQGGRTPLFLVHGAAGITFLRPTFQSGLSPEQPVYVFQAKGYDGLAEPLDRVEDIATGYLRSMLEISPDGPWHLGSFCAGGWIASEIIHQMRLEGLEPRKVIIVDPSVPLSMRKGYKLKKGRIGRLTAPLGGDGGARLGRLAMGLARRIEFFWKTGHFVNGYEPEASEIPAVRQYLVSRMKGKNNKRMLNKMRRRAESFGDALPGKGQDEDAPERVYSSDAAALTSARLQLAFRRYTPRPLNFPVHAICSAARAAGHRDTAHPFNVMLPNRRIFISGETHAEAVMSTRTATIIQSILDDDEERIAGLMREDRPAAVR